MQLKVKDPNDPAAWLIVPTTGPVGPAGPIGLDGPIGPQGEPGVSSIIIGDFGAVATPATLPVDGLIPIDWDGVGNPVVAYQMVLGQSLYYDNSTDLLDGHLFQFVSTAVDPTGWLDIGLIQGPPGPQGDIGPEGPMSDDLYVGPDDPVTVKPTAELWYDTDDTRILGPVDLPVGGVVGRPLIKLSDVDGDVGWGGNAADGAVMMTLGSWLEFLAANNLGIIWDEGARIYKRIGGPLCLRKDSAGRQPVVQNNDGGGESNIITANGAVSMEAPLGSGTALGAKFYVYGTTFGIGVESGTLVAFFPVGNKISFRTGNTTGTECAYIDVNGLGPRSNINVSWLNGFSGTCQFRVNPAVISCHMINIGKGGDTTEPTRIKMFDYPSGVPAPWAQMRVAVNFQAGAAGSGVYWNAGEVHFSTDGVFLNVFDNRRLGDGEDFSCSCTWAR